MNAKTFLIKWWVVVLAITAIGAIGATGASAQVAITVDSPTAFVAGGNLHMVVSEIIPGSGGLPFQPSSATFSATGGGGTYSWSLSVNGGQIDATGTTVQYQTPESITVEPTQVTVTVADAVNQTDTATYTVFVYNIVRITSPTAPLGLAVGDNLTVAASGGTGNYDFEIVDGNPNNNVATLGATPGASVEVTAAAQGTFKVRARDNSYGDFSVDNAYRSNKDDFPLITVIPAIAVTGVDAVTSGQVVDFDASGGSTTNYTWTADAGTIDATGLFTPPTVSTGSQVVTIQAYDSVYGQSSSTPIFGEKTVTVYAPVAVDLPTGYDGGDSSTWPLLASPGATYPASASGGTGTYDWTAVNTTLGGAAKTPTSLGTDVASITINIDTLFGYDGAGAYLIQAKDSAQATFVASSFQVRVPVRIAPSSISFADDQNQAFIADGTTAGFTWEQTDLAGNVVDPPTAGGFDAQGGNSVTLQQPANPKLTAALNFRLKATTSDPDLVADGLQTAMTDVLTVIPLYSVTIQVNEAGSGDPVVNALVNFTVSDQAPVATNASGQATFPIVPALPGGYVLTAVADGYYAKTFSLTNVAAATPQATVALEPIPLPLSTVSGTVSPPGAGTVVQIYDNGDNVLTDTSGNPVMVLADPTNGNYAVQFPNTFAPNYTVTFSRIGYVTNGDDNLGVLKNVAAGAGQNITLQPETIINVATLTGATSFDARITASPNAFDNTAGEIAIFDGLDASAPDITADFNWNAGASGYDTDTSVAIPAPGDSVSITIRADTTTARTANSGYYAERIATYVAGLPEPPSASIASGTLIAGIGGNVQTTGGASKVVVPAGGVLVPENIVVTINEIDNTKAGAPGIVGTLVDVSVRGASSGTLVGAADIQQIFITISFDPSAVTSGCFEAGTCAAYHAPSLADMVAGNKTAIPPSQIIPMTDYDTGRVMFWTSSVSTFGVGAAAATPTPPPAGGGGGGGCFIAASSSGLLPVAPVALLLLTVLAVIAYGMAVAVWRSR